MFYKVIALQLAPLFGHRVRVKANTSQGDRPAGPVQLESFLSVMDTSSLRQVATCLPSMPPPLPPGLVMPLAVPTVPGAEFLMGVALC